MPTKYEVRVYRPLSQSDVGTAIISKREIHTNYNFISRASACLASTLFGTFIAGGRNQAFN